MKLLKEQGLFDPELMVALTDKNADITKEDPDRWEQMSLMAQENLELTTNSLHH